LRLTPWRTPNLISVKATAFAETDLIISSYGANTNNADYDYNAFLSGEDQFPIGGANDVVVSQFDWQSGPMGEYYLPVSGTNLARLINAGSDTADSAGLYHFTTQTNEVREAATQVDIGFHYLTTACNSIDVVWVDDSTPAGASRYTMNETWNWIASNPTPFSAASNHQSAIYAYTHQHYFMSATETLTVNTGDLLIAYVYLDPANTPRQVMLQWNNGSWEHRAYWGENLIGWGVTGTDSRRYMGALPATGQWVRLEVPAADVGLEGATLTGMAFTLYDGRASWDYAGKSGGIYCFDTDSDGIPDYLEDANGNGTYEAADMASWVLSDTDSDGIGDGVEVAIGTDAKQANTMEGLNGVAGFQVFTPLH
jgi:hypothetical protein